MKEAGLDWKDDVEGRDALLAEEAGIPHEGPWLFFPLLPAPSLTNTHNMAWSWV